MRVVLIVVLACALCAAGCSPKSEQPKPTTSEDTYETMTAELGRDGEVGTAEIRKRVSTGEYELKGTDGGWYPIALTFDDSATQKEDVLSDWEAGSGFKLQANQDIYFRTGERAGIIRLEEPVPWQ